MSNTPIQGSSSKPNVAAEDYSRSSSRTNILSVRNRSATRMKKNSRPNLKRLGSVSHPQGLVYSVDDDINENDKDDSTKESQPKSDRDYLEGYNDALRALSNRKGRTSSGHLSIAGTPLRSPEEIATIESKLAKDLTDAEEQMRLLEDLDSGPTPNVTDEFVEPEDNNEDAGSIKSTSTVESLNLKERQNAINSTHPFGIKIWKPSLYKKKRSVATRAEEDIHDFDPRKPTARIYWGVKLTNIVWSLTAGLLICLICLLGAAFVFIFSGFAIERKLRPYVKALLKLGHYWLYPFGKFVLLNREQNYLDEDQLEGRTINEFHQWRLQEEGRLFFAPPRRYTGSESTRPLLKDHRGRPLRDAYSLLDDGIQEEEDEQDNDANDIKVRFFGRGDWSFGRIAFYVYLRYYPANFLFHRHLVLAHRVHHPHGENHKHHERPYETTPIGIGLRARKGLLQKG